MSFTGYDVYPQLSSVILKIMQSSSCVWSFFPISNQFRIPSQGWWINSNLSSKDVYVLHQSLNLYCSRRQILFQRMQHVHESKRSHQPPHFAYLTYFYHHIFCPDHLQNIKKGSSSPSHSTSTTSRSQLSGFLLT